MVWHMRVFSEGLMYNEPRSFVFRGRCSSVWPLPSPGQISSLNVWRSFCCCLEFSSAPVFVTVLVSLLRGLASFGSAAQSWNASLGACSVWMFTDALICHSQCWLCLWQREKRVSYIHAHNNLIKGLYSHSNKMCKELSHLYSHLDTVE